MYLAHSTQSPFPAGCHLLHIDRWRKKMPYAIHT